MNNRAQTRFSGKMKPLALACLAILSAPAFAEEAEKKNDEEMEHIYVIGQVASVSSSLHAQREADNFITVATADAIGNFPDANASESLQRMVGLSIERDQGEGRFVRVRGLAPDYNAVTINGSRVPSPEAGRRAVALDVVPSDLVQTLTVTKSLTPDMDASSLGGAVDIKSASAFDREGTFFKFNAETGYNDLEGEVSPKISGSYSDTFLENTFGVAIAGSWLERSFGSDNVETGGGWDFDDETLLEELEQRNYQITRERTGLAANFDWRPDENTSVYLRALYSEFADDEQRNGIVTEWEDGVEIGSEGDAEVARELKDREEIQTITSVVLGADVKVNEWMIDYQVGWSKADEENPGYTKSEFALDDTAELAVNGSKKPRVTAPDAYYDYDAYELKEIEVSDTLAEDTQKNIAINLARTFDWHEMDVDLKFGGKMSSREKTNQEAVWIFEDLDEEGVAQSELLMSGHLGGNVDYDLGNFGQAINSASIRALTKELGRDGFEDEVESQINNFRINEDINAAYVMATARKDAWSIIAGVRYEGTELTSEGWKYDDTTETFTAQAYESDDNHFFPSVQMRYDFSPELVLRGAWTNTIIRPSFDQLAPSYVLEEDDGEYEAEFGNPDLEALESMNFDVALEYYMGNVGVASAGVFYKDIENFAFPTDLAGSEGYENFAKAETYANGDNATLFGVELNWVKQFAELPAPFNGMLLSANGTYTDSDAEISYYDDGEQFSRGIPLPSQSEYTANFAAGYEDELLSLRLSAAYKSEYLLEVDALDDANYDVYEDAHLQIDFIAKAQIMENVQVYFNAINLTNEAYYTYANSTRYNVQYEEYGRSYQLGVTVTGL